MRREQVRGMQMVEMAHGGGGGGGDDEEQATVPLIRSGEQATSSSGNGQARKEEDSLGARSGSFTVEEAINHVGFGRFQLGMVTYTGLIFLADAAEMILLSFIGPSARCEWQLSPVQEGAISSVVFVGILLGSCSWGVVSDLRGRRFAFCITACFTTFFGLWSAWSPTFWILLLSRTLVGFGLGGMSVAFALCMEFLPENGRGFWLVFLEVYWTAGSILEGLLAWILIPNVNWRWLVAVSALPFFVLLSFIPILPESPRFLMIKGDTQGALRILQRVAKVNGKALPPGELTAFVPADTVSPVVSPGHTKRAEHVENGEFMNGGAKQVEADPLESEEKGVLYTFKLLFSPELKKTTLLLWFLFLANAFAYYGLVLLTTQLRVKGETGGPCDDVKVIHDDSKMFCTSSGRPVIDTSQYKTVLISCIAEFPGLMVACLIVEKYGRKASLQSLLIACGLFMIPLMIPMTWLTTNMLMFGARSCIMGAFSVLWAYAPELFYTKVRATAIGTTTSGARLGGFLCPFVAVGLIEICQRVLAVGLFAVIPVLAGLGAFLLPKEHRKV